MKPRDIENILAIAEVRNIHKAYYTEETDGYITLLAITEFRRKQRLLCMI